jgi:uncharacterized protein
MLITLILWLLVLALALFIIRAHYLEPRRLGLSRWRVAVPDLPPALEGLKVLHLSDLHLKSADTPFPRQMAQRAVALALAQDPDIICLTGDLTQASRHAAEAAAVLRPLAHKPTYAVMGNHDHDKMLESEFGGPRRADCRWRNGGRRSSPPG